MIQLGCSKSWQPKDCKKTCSWEIQSWVQPDIISTQSFIQQCRAFMSLLVLIPYIANTELKSTHIIKSWRQRHTLLLFLSPSSLLLLLMLFFSSSLLFFFFTWWLNIQGTNPRLISGLDTRWTLPEFSLWWERDRRSFSGQDAVLYTIRCQTPSWQAVLTTLSYRGFATLASLIYSHVLLNYACSSGFSSQFAKDMMSQFLILRTNSVSVFDFSLQTCDADVVREGCGACKSMHIFLLIMYN